LRYYRGMEPAHSELESLRKANKRKSILLWIAAAFIIGLSALIIWTITHQTAKQSQQPSTTATTTKPTTETATVPGLPLDTSKNYGNKYSSGILPVGDNKYVTDAPKKGSVYVCHANFVPAGQAGAQTRGPWFVNNNTEWDSTKKANVSGNVSWEHAFSQKIVDGKRILTTNDLPDHTTGVFPVQASDLAYRYDRNPNSIKAQSLTYTLAEEPTYSDTAHCMSGEVGVMLSGAAIFNAFDAGGRDAGAWEVQDGCQGHPQNKGEYHYHTLSSCIKNATVDTVIGYALDGFPITGPTISSGNILTTEDLDECHGITSEITLDGKKTKTYHYVMTQDFPYSVSCFRAEPTNPPGLPEH
jgi:hypothetical protein